MPDVSIKVKRGDQKFLYRSTSQDYASVVWNLVDSLSSNKISRDAGAKEYMLRKSAYIGTVPGKTKLGLTIEFADIEGDADLNAFISAVENKTPMILAYANGDITVDGTKFTQAVYSITKQESDEPEDDVAKITFEASVTGIESYEPIIEVVS